MTTTFETRTKMTVYRGGLWDDLARFDSWRYVSMRGGYRIVSNRAEEMDVMFMLDRLGIVDADVTNGVFHLKSGQTLDDVTDYLRYEAQMMEMSVKMMAALSDAGLSTVED